MVLDELGRLDEHATRSAARVVDAAVVGLDDLDERAHDAGGRVELAGVLSLLLGELREAVLVGPAENILGVAFGGHLDIGEEVHHIAEHALVELLAREVLGEDALEGVVLGLYLPHCVVDDLADLRGMRRGCYGLPAGISGDPEDALRLVLVAVLLKALALGHELGVLLLESVGDVLQEDEPEHHVLVFGRVDVAAHPIGSLPDLLLEADLLRVGGFRRLVLAAPWPSHVLSLPLVSLERLVVRPRLALRHHGVQRLALLVGRVLVLLQQPLDGAPHASTCCLLLLPVYRRVLS